MASELPPEHGDLVTQRENHGGDAVSKEDTGASPTCQPPSVARRQDCSKGRRLVQSATSP